jgi:hypothetical protein
MPTRAQRTSVEWRALVRVVIGLALAAPACAEVPPETRAAETAQLQCDASTTGDADLRLIRDMMVLSVKPVYAIINSSATGMDKIVVGAKILIRPLSGFDADRVARTLQCHTARAVLGQLEASAFPDDPFRWPGKWVEIGVASEAGNVAITVKTDGVRSNLDLLARARLFGAAHVPPPSQG